MEPKNIFSSSQNELKKLKILLSKFEVVVHDINVLHDKETKRTKTDFRAADPNASNPERDFGAASDINGGSYVYVPPHSFDYPPNRADIHLGATSSTGDYGHVSTKGNVNSGTNCTIGGYVNVPPHSHDYQTNRADIHLGATSSTVDLTKANVNSGTNCTIGGYVNLPAHSFDYPPNRADIHLGATSSTVDLTKANVNSGKNCTIGDYVNLPPHSFDYPPNRADIHLGATSSTGDYGHVSTKGNVNSGTNCTIGGYVNLPPHSFDYPPNRADLHLGATSSTVDLTKANVNSGKNCTIGGYVNLPPHSFDYPPNRADIHLGATSSTVDLTKANVNSGKNCTIGDYVNLPPHSFDYPPNRADIHLGATSSTGDYGHVSTKGNVNSGTNCTIGGYVNLPAHSFDYPPNRADIHLGATSSTGDYGHVSTKGNVNSGTNCTIGGYVNLPPHSFDYPPNRDDIHLGATSSTGDYGHVSTKGNVNSGTNCTIGGYVNLPPHSFDYPPNRADIHLGATSSTVDLTKANVNSGKNCTIGGYVNLPPHSFDYPPNRDDIHLGATSSTGDYGHVSTKGNVNSGTNCTIGGYVNLPPHSFDYPPNRADIHLGATSSTVDLTKANVNSGKNCTIGGYVNVSPHSHDYQTNRVDLHWGATSSTVDSTKANVNSGTNCTIGGYVNVPPHSHDYQTNRVDLHWGATSSTVDSTKANVNSGTNCTIGGYVNVPPHAHYYPPNVANRANVNSGTNSEIGSYAYASNEINLTKNTSGNYLEHEFEAATDCNVMVNGTNSNNHVMGVELPNDNVFDEMRLHAILNKPQTNTLNYFYYLSGNTDACNVDYNLHSTTTNVMETTVHVIEQSNSLYTGVTRDQNTFGPTGETGELEPDSEFSKVNVTTMKDVLDEPVLRKIDIKITHGCDNLNMMVPTSSDPNPKKYCCVYCNKRYSNLVRHLLFLHKNEPEVKKIRDSPPGSKQRRKVIDNLRNRGQFIWNTNAEINGKELSTCRRPNKKFNRTAPQFKTCPNCYGAFVFTNLNHHFKSCTNAILKGERIVMELSRAIEGRTHIDACEELRNEVFARMRENEYVRSIRYDWLIITFGNDLCLNYDITLESQFKMICTKLGDAGKLLVASKSIASDISDFASLFQVKNCNTVVSAIHKVAGFDRKSKKFRSRGLASALATLMNAIGELLLVEVMRLGDRDHEANVERFLKVFQKDVRNKVNRLVALQQSQARRERVENIPSTFDVNQIATYVDRERDQCFAELSEQFTEEKWLYLSQLTVLSIMLFNRRRTGESKTILQKEYENRQTITGNSNIPDDVRELVNSMMRVRGKRNRTVPVLLHHSYEDCIDLIIRHRADAGVPEQNKFLFALPSKSGKIKTIDTCQAVKTISEKSGVQNHTSLRGTNLRKQLASFCSTLNLSDNDVTNVANHMGHDDPIHREFYRHNPLEREVVQMTRILVAAQGNHINTPGTSSDEFRKKLPDEYSSECGGSIVKKGGKSGTAKIAAARSNRKERGKVGKRGRSRQ